MCCGRPTAPGTRKKAVADASDFPRQGLLCLAANKPVLLVECRREVRKDLQVACLVGLYTPEVVDQRRRNRRVVLREFSEALPTQPGRPLRIHIEETES